MPKNLVVCCDGTSNKPTSARTNVLKLWLALDRSAGQKIYYDPGVGTLGSPGGLTSIGKAFDRKVDLATGKGIRQNVIEAYEFLMEFYEDGDAIFLFGFSRGAYTVRALAGVIDLFGLLEYGGRNFVPYLWQFYSNDEREKTSFGKRMQIAAQFEALGRRPSIRCLGVWDTVSSWGWFFNFRSLPRTAKIECVEHIRHAVAIDERRAAFRANLFDPDDNQDLHEVWFSGTHCDVGGGHAEEESGLSKLALAWMFEEAQMLGLKLDAARAAEILGRAGSIGRAAPDACGVLHDSLKGGWRFLEWLPRPVWDWKKKRRTWKANRGQRRFFRDMGSAVHVSVGERSRKMGYRPHHVVVD